MQKEGRLLRIGVLGCGPIAQAAHLEACRKARNAELYAICDAAGDLAARMAEIHRPRAVYHDLDRMLADPALEAVIVATADGFHVPLARRVLAAGKHVFVEKPLGVGVEECEELGALVRASGRVLQVGHMKRFDPGIAFARAFVAQEMGARMGLKAWYYDSVYRYTMTDNLQPLPVASRLSVRPAGDPKGERRRYLLLAHGSHLVDTARILGGELVAVQARLLERFGAYGWFVSVDFADGSLGHLDLAVAIRGDFEEGFHLYGENGSAKGTIYLPWFHKTSVVECFSTKDRLYRRPLGEDAHTYRRQIEGFAATILEGAPQAGADVADGIAAVRAVVAIARSAESGRSVRLAEVEGEV